jgi:hypothetical protein
MADSASIRAKYDIRKQQMHQFQSFTASGVGYGPFIVQRQHLRDEIIQKANPHRSVHISGCRGAGKTTLLHLLGLKLVKDGKTVFFFNNSAIFQQYPIIHFIDELETSKEEAIILVDETQNNPQSPVFTTLLKNVANHKITTIGAGVQAFESASGHFTSSIPTHRLFLSSDATLKSEGVVDYFCHNACMHEQEITALLNYIRSYVGGHMYPFMWTAEKLVPCITRDRKTAAHAISIFHSEDFRGSDDFKDMANRIRPPQAFSLTSFRALLTTNPNDHAVKQLYQNGFYDEGNSLISQLLFETFANSIAGQKTFPQGLNRGLDGVQQLLQFALPNMSWDQYTPFGGPIEDALSFELMLILSRLSHLRTRLFNPKLIQAGFSGKKPDLYLNGTVDAYIECVLTTANNTSERKKLDEHISRFYWGGYTDVNRRNPPPYYPIGSNQAFAILNYQTFGREPLEPFEGFFVVTYLNNESSRF